MADKAISELLAANQVTPTDLFVLEQSGVAKKLTGQTLENWLLSFADGHGGIQSIVKKGTSGLVDTYRITLADTTTFDFTVTNGKAISSVGQTSVSGLTRTYTIAFNDGTSQTFKVTDGRSITNIAKTGTNGLTDTYTISYNDGTSSTFTVKNGKGIQSFANVSTDGLVDTYRIEYNDGTFDEFTVTNGAKGDQGDNTYTHIKFASQEPTEASHSFGDVPDKWIGFYWGNSSAAPTDWTQYKWYQFKGDQGATGLPATLVKSVVEYQVGTSGTVVPSEAWSTSVPMVPQSKYLWTRTTTTFNTGAPIVSYSVSRMGLDGLGSVVSINNIAPNAEGNIHLVAADVGARDNTWVPNASEVGAAPMEYAKKVGNPHNLLDNSDFRNPVNQRGFTSGSVATNAYFIDRWKAWSSIQISGLSTNGLQMTSGVLRQDLASELTAVLVGKRITFAAKIDGTVCVCHATVSQPGVYTQLAVNAPLEMAVTSSGLLCCGIRTSSAITIEWAALYEGEYTAETLPEYQPKGYGAELAECQRYQLVFKPLIINGAVRHASVGTGLGTSYQAVEIDIPMPVSLRSGVIPTLIFSGKIAVWDGASSLDVGNYGVVAVSSSSMRINCAVHGTITAGHPYVMTVLNENADGYFIIDANL